MNFKPKNRIIFIIIIAIESCKRELKIETEDDESNF